jgi:hypothetical protein
MNLNIKYLVLPVLVALAFIAHPAYSQDSTFRREKLSYGISLDVPSHWTVLSAESRKNTEAAGQAISENAGVEGTLRRRESLIAVNATPDPTGALIRISITSDPEYTQSDLVAATQGELKELRLAMLKTFQQMEATGGPKIIEMQPARVEQLNNYRVLVLSYTRASLNGPSPWQVTQYKVPVSDRLVEITLSHRQSDSIVWRPILEKVKRSIRF